MLIKTKCFPSLKTQIRIVFVQKYFKSNQLNGVFLAVLYSIHWLVFLILLMNAH